MVVVAILGTAFLSAFSSLLKTSASPMQTAVMESLAAGQLDRALSGSFQSAVAVSGTTIPLNVDGTPYWAVFTGVSSVIGNVTVASGIHLTVTLSADNCVSCVSLSGDSFDVQ